MPGSAPEALDLLALTGDVVAAFVADNSLPANELVGLIQSVHAALTAIASGEAVPSKDDTATAPLTPAIPVRKSITPDYLICLDDGKKFKSMRRHLAALGMTPDEYRAKWKLPADYPMVAANYAAVRSALAKKVGLGQIGKRGSAPKSEAAPESKPARGRPRKATA